MRGPPQLLFDDGSRAMMEDSENIIPTNEREDGSSSLSPIQRGNIPLHIYYEIDRMSQEVIDLLVVPPTHKDEASSSVIDNGILRVALQFPDELLEDSPEVCWLLEDKIREQLDAMPTISTTEIIPFCFVLGDTTVNSCCPDEVAALHLNADVLIHYGHACLSPTGTLPVLYSFGKLDFEDIDGAVEELQAARTERKRNAGDSSDNQYNNYLVLYQLGYYHAVKDLQERWMKEDATLQVVTAEIPTPSRPENQKPKCRPKIMEKDQTSCCQQPNSSIDSNANIIGQNGGCCGNNAGSSTVVLQESHHSGEASSSSCCRKDEDSRNDAPVALLSLSANIISEGESIDRNDFSRPLVIGGLELPGDKISSLEDLSDFTVVFIMGNPDDDADNYSTDDKTTPQQRQYANSLLCFLSLPHGEPEGGYWIYSPRFKTLRTDVSPPPALKRQLKRRFFLTQKARDANVFGILVSNLSQQHLVDVVKSLQKIIQDDHRTAYSFAVGKINPAKLANFAEIEAFVIVACREHSLLDMEREYPIPVITPMELEIALENLQWGMQPYSLDCQDVMIRQEQMAQKRKESNGGSEMNEVTDDDNSVDSDAPYYSMVTGRYESRKQRGSNNHDLDLAALPGQGQVTEYKSEAANFLRQREYQGLETMVGQTEVKPAVLGMRGIASDYRDEENTN